MCVSKDDSDLAPSTPRNKGAMALNRNSVVSKLKARADGKLAIVSNVVADPALGLHQKEETGLIKRVTKTVRESIAKVKNAVAKNKLKSVFILLVLVGLALAHKKGTASGVEKDIRDLIKNPSKYTNAQAMGIIRKNKDHVYLKKHGGGDDLCKYTSSMCSSGFMGRSYMPQLGIPDDATLRMPAFEAAGGRLMETTLTADMLKPIQKELLISKVGKMAEGYNSKKFSTDSKPILAAKVGDQYYVIDGHHRWAASWAHDPKAKIKASVMELTDMKSIMQALGFALSHPDTKFANLLGKSTG
jgi:hypothetical protein